MNGKRAKRIRQLVRHLQTKDSVQQLAWTVYAPANPYNTTVTLNPHCGKAICRTLKRTTGAGHLPGKAHA